MAARTRTHTYIHTHAHTRPHVVHDDGDDDYCMDTRTRTRTRTDRTGKFILFFFTLSHTLSHSIHLTLSAFSLLFLQTTTYGCARLASTTTCAWPAVRRTTTTTRQPQGPSCRHPKLRTYGDGKIGVRTRNTRAGDENLGRTVGRTRRQIEK